MEEEEGSPSPTLSGPSLLISPAIIVAIGIGIFVATVVALLCLRKFILTHYGEREWVPTYCKNTDCGSGCGQSCITIAEKLDCQTPSSDTCLNRICPSQQRCATVFSKVFSCYCCHTVSEYCKGVQICPESSPGGFKCPECDCPCNCHCECTPPECQEINCGCFKISFAGTGSRPVSP